MGDELVKVADAVRDEAELELVRSQIVEHGKNVLVELEVLRDLPAALDLRRALGGDRLGSAHADEDLLGEEVPDRVVVQELRVALDVEDCGIACRFVRGDVELDAVTGRDARVPPRRQLRAGAAEREVDVE